MEERALPARRPKYQSLGDWLATQPGARVTLRFGEVERLLGHRLSTTAWSDSSWWWTANRKDLWHAPGWRLEAVDRRRAVATFVRVDPASEPVP
jgi:hypothetical protein